MLMRARGFTLIELLISASIFTLVASTSFPMVHDMLQQKRLHAASYTFTSALATARIEAVKSSRPASLCVSSDGVTCDKDSGDWELGFLVYVDDNRDGSLEAGERIIQYVEGIEGGATIRATTPGNLITYKPDGSAKLQAIFNVCIDGEADHGRTINLTITGRADIRSGADRCPNTFGETIAIEETSEPDNA